MDRNLSFSPTYRCWAGSKGSLLELFRALKCEEKETALLLSRPHVRCHRWFARVTLGAAGSRYTPWDAADGNPEYFSSVRL